MPDRADIELTILMPCLNEAETIGVCLDKAASYLRKSGIKGELLIADNGSTDGSVEIAKERGARVVRVRKKGYGSALRGGQKAARGRYVIMGDSDDSYDFEHLQAFIDRLRQGYDLVMGNRFKGGIARGAMPFMNRYIGNPLLSFIGKKLFDIPVGDFHCGLRGYDRAFVEGLKLRSPGMEYASEMVIKSALAGGRIAEVPTTLKKDGRSKRPHLRPLRDGYRHLRLMLALKAGIR